MCIPMPPPPPAAPPTPPAPPPAPEPPAPAPAPGNPPGVPPAAVAFDLQNSKIIQQNGVPTTFAKIQMDNGLVVTGSGGLPSVRAQVVLQNVTSEIAAVNLNIYDNTGLLTYNPTVPQTFNIPANNYVTAEVWINPINNPSAGGTYQVTFTIGASSVTLKLALIDLNP